MDSPANTPYRRTNSNTAAASMAFMLRTAVLLFDGYECGRGYLKTKKLQRSENLKAKSAIRKHLPNMPKTFQVAL